MTAQVELECFRAECNHFAWNTLGLWVESLTKDGSS